MAKVKTLPSVEALARKFSASLLEDLGANIMKEVVTRNASPQYADCCASHDFCDANETMLDAVQSFGFTWDDIMENDCENPLQARWNEAWDFAKKQKFFAQ